MSAVIKIFYWTKIYFVTFIFNDHDGNTRQLNRQQSFFLLLVLTILAHSTDYEPSLREEHLDIEAQMLTTPLNDFIFNERLVVKLEVELEMLDIN